MARKGWHRVREDGAVTIARRLPVRFDLTVETLLPCARPVSLTAVAQQVRQDMWRRLQGIRGFAPAVRVEEEPGALRVTAGGEIAGQRPTAAARGTLEELLESPVHRQRWLAHAGRRGDAQ